MYDYYKLDLQQPPVMGSLELLLWLSQYSPSLSLSLKEGRVGISFITLVGLACLELVGEPKWANCIENCRSYYSHLITVGDIVG